MPRRARTPVAVGRYALMWALAVALLAGAALTALPRKPRPATAAALEHDAERGRCVLRRDAGGTQGLDVMQPPTYGPRATPAAPGVYTRPPGTRAIVGALRRGSVVLHYRRDTPTPIVTALRRARAGDAIVMPGTAGMRYAVAATAWGRLLGCPRATPHAVEAIRTFTVTYRGRGPDAPR